MSDLKEPISADRCSVRSRQAPERRQAPSEILALLNARIGDGHSSIIFPPFNSCDVRFWTTIMSNNFPITEAQLVGLFMECIAYGTYL